MSAPEKLALAGSVVAIVASAVAIVVSIRAESRASRAEGRAKRAERRDEERLEAERQARAADTRARVVVDEDGGSGTRKSPTVIHRYKVTNLGLAPAREIRLWIENESGTPVSSLEQIETLAPKSAPAYVDVEVNRLNAGTDKLALWIEWRDDDVRREWTGITPPDFHDHTYGAF